MKKRALILLILTAIWTLGSWWYYTCKIKGFCGTSNTALDNQSQTTPPNPAPIPVKSADGSQQVTDSDGDGLTDGEEAAIGTNPQKADSDADGIPDNEEVGSTPSQPIDTDADGKINALDTDDDNDGLETSLEAAIGINPLQKDTDGDGIDDATEVGNNSGVPLNSDDDKLIDAIDPDDDNDGLPTVDENLLGTNPLKADTDGDGIPDGEEVDSNSGEVKDTDGDGVIDALDNDNTTSKKPATDAAPVENTDADKANKAKADEANKDKTEDTKTAEQPADDEVTLEPIESATNTSIKGSRLYFPFRSAETKLSKSTSAYFSKVVTWLKESPSNKVILTGHTDNVGAASANKKLGLKRALLVKNMLIKKGAPKAQIKAVSKGETKPLRSNKTDAGRKKNRRVQLTPVGKGAK